MKEQDAYKIAGQILDGSIKIEPHIGQQIADRIVQTLLAIQQEPQVMQKIVDLIEYHKHEASEPFLSLKALQKAAFKEDYKKTVKILNNHIKMMKKKHNEWIKILESNFSV